jgi:hypothetical protein
VLSAERAHVQSQHQLAIPAPSDVNRAESDESTVMGQYTGIHTMIKNAIEGHIPVLAYPNDPHLGTISVFKSEALGRDHQKAAG